MTIAQYIDTVNKRYTSGISREHSYRGDFENLFRALIKDVEITNEPANVTDCGNPDYVLTKGKIPIGYIEAKDIGKDLNSKSYKEQFGRYRKALDNLIITDYIWFQFFQNGELVHEIRIAELEDGKVKPIEANYKEFESLLTNFAAFIGQTIKSSKKLAEMMAAKAKLLQNILERAVTSDEETHENTSIQSQYATFKEILIHDLTPKGFADIYAQTLAYGMFAARLHDPTLEDFSRQEAAELIPKSNPFLRRLFGYVAGADIDERIKPTVDNLADVYRATDVKDLLKDFGKSTQQHDPIIHFYETFLAAYDPKLRKARGVWYTPEPVVKFIVRAVDDILKDEFGLAQGLADTSKIKIKVKSQKADKRYKERHATVEKEVHKVQILDPATGTGTFLAEVIKYIYSTKFKAMQGAWSGYVEEHLIPRLNGFELLMASYSMAHLKLDMLLADTGFKATKNQRFNVFLTNSLEEHHPDTGTLFSNWLSSEANEANHIKRDTPVMCVIGNPPYSISSSNKSKFIEKLTEDYKRNLNEKNIQPLSDDYIKFIRYGHHHIEKNGAGVLAYISNNSFLDGITHRQMRTSLIESFNKIYILDLHGSAKKNEKTVDGGSDENVFDIQQGVSINIFIKISPISKKREIKHFNLLGKRSFKYDYLHKNTLSSINWKMLKAESPYNFFALKDFSGRKSYELGFSIKEIFETYNTGIETGRDKFFVDIEKSALEEKVQNVINNIEAESVKEEYKIKDNANFKLLTNLKKATYKPKHIKSIAYRPFDIRSTYYDTDLQRRPSIDSSKHMHQPNLALLSCRQQSTFDFQHVFISNSLAERCTVSLQTKETSYQFPLYLYQGEGSEAELFSESRSPNLSHKIIEKIALILNLEFTAEDNNSKTTFSPVDVLDYIYSILHCPKYRKKYKEFLKIDFPVIPYPKDINSFMTLVKFGSKLRQIHLLETSIVEDFNTSYPKDGTNTITTKIGKKDWEIFDEKKQLGRIWINAEQYFDQIPITAWEFYIGGYQPAQKWLKDRKGRTLSFDDILHYQKIIVALLETERLMKEIDKIDFMDK
jgi:predicted helicase